MLIVFFCLSSFHKKFLICFWSTKFNTSSKLVTLLLFAFLLLVIVLCKFNFNLNYFNLFWKKFVIFLFWVRSEKVKITGLPVYLAFFFEKLLKFNQEIFNEDLHFAIEQLANLITSHPFFSCWMLPIACITKLLETKLCKYTFIKRYSVIYNYNNNTILGK